MSDSVNRKGDWSGELRPFHLAFPVIDLVSARQWYVEVLGCVVGRESESSCVLNLFGHQIVAHKVDEMPEIARNRVDEKAVPTSHFGCVLEWEHWHALAEELENRGVDFIIEPHIRYRGKPGEQATMFFSDPCGNNLEFKSFKDEDGIFSSY